MGCVAGLVANQTGPNWRFHRRDGSNEQLLAATKLKAQGGCLFRHGALMCAGGGAEVDRDVDKRGQRCTQRGQRAGRRQSCGGIGGGRGEA